MEDLPTYYDAIVVGTGLVESIYAAAAARVGKTVLHIDSNTHYSGEWAVLGLTGLLEWTAKHTSDQEECPPPPANAEPDTRPLRTRRLIHGVAHHWYIEEGEADVEEPPLRRLAGGSGDGTTTAESEAATEPTSQGPAQAGNNSGETPDATATPAVQPEEQSVQATESSETPVESSETPVESSETPVESSETPVESSETPVESSETPVESSETPVESSETPVESSETPVESSETPSESVTPAAEPVSDSAAPATSESTPTGPKLAPKKSPEWTINRMKKLTRRFNIDLAPKVLYSRGALVELLISSNIARYAEFRAVGQLLTPLHGQLQPVPSSRADVFTTRHVSVVEKRLLMKLLSFCAEFEKHPEEYKGYEEKPFSEFLRARRLTDNLTHHVTHAIAMVTPHTPTLEALRSTQKFLRSLGRYGNTPFLWPMYGSGEIPQCFCRMCAVFGGVYHLSRGVEALTVDEDGVLTGVVSAGHRLTCRRLVLEDAYREDREEDGAGVSRAVLITDGPLYAPADDQVLLIRLPASEDHPGPVTVLQVGLAASAAPAGLFVIHLTCAAHGSAEEDLAPAVARLQLLAAASGADRDGGSGPAAPPLRVLSALYFSRRSGGRGSKDAGLPDSVAVCSGPDDAIGFDGAVQEARDMFTAHFPGEEFLPRAPDPEEIIFFDEPTESVVTGGARPTEAESNGSAGQDGEGKQVKQEEQVKQDGQATGETAAAAGEAAPDVAEAAEAGEVGPTDAAEAEGAEAAVGASDTRSGDRSQGEAADGS